MTEDNVNPETIGSTAELTKARLAALFYRQVERILMKPDASAAELTFANKVMENNSITLGMVERGDFGEFGAKVVAEEFPDFDSPTFTH